MRASARLLGLVLLLCGACAAPEPAPEKQPFVPPPPPPWTNAFAVDAVLVAEEVHIEGPQNLLEHVATRQDPATVNETRTTTQGLEQVIALRPGVDRAEIRAQLDGLKIVALRRLVVLQRPGSVPVRVRAVGSAFWSKADGSEQRRDDALELRGELGK